VPILAEEAIEGTGLVENSQVLVAIFRSLSISKIGVTCPYPPGADPIGYAVGGQRVIIPTSVPLIGTGPDESGLPVLPHPTVAFSTLPDKALIEAKAALFSPSIFGRRWRQIEGVSRLKVRLLDIGHSSFNIGTNTIGAKLKNLGDKKRLLATSLALDNSFSR
jgi:hypothetical protein